MREMTAVNLMTAMKPIASYQAVTIERDAMKL